MLNALTFDLEDWYHGFDLPPARWLHFADRLDIGLSRVLAILEEFRVKATFFVLGHVAETHPGAVEAVVARGHEIGSHGYSHTPIYRQSPDEFRRELERSLYALQAITRRPVAGHRAAFFSIIETTRWALDAIAEQGLRYDTSIFPIHNYRYGMPGAPRFPHILWQDSDRPLVEFPISTLRCGPVNIPFSGGAYARAWPYAFIRWAIAGLNAQGQPVVVYFHPWELDTEHPRLRDEARRVARWTHYHNLESTEAKLRRLLGDFRWGPMSEVLRQYSAVRYQPSGIRCQVSGISGRLTADG